MSPAVEIVTEAPGWEALGDAEEIARRSVGAALSQVARPYNPDAELSVVLADDARVRELNRTWRGKDSATNVLSFPAAEDDEIETAPLLGDIILAFETVADEARRDGKSLADHFAHLVVHGTLHLFGFDHMTEAEAEEMENAERAALATLGIDDPYKESDPA